MTPAMANDVTANERITVEVTLPPQLLDDLDEYRYTHGYATRSGVVTDALKK